MLKFIVLGQIPGTEIQLTFQQILLVAAIFYGGLLLSHELRQLERSKVEKIITQQAL